MVPFGFSAGDFVSAVGLIARISKALRASGGAVAECRVVIQDLHTLQQLLRLLEAFRPANGNLGHVNAIRGMALACLIPLRAFADKLDRRYEPALGVGSSKGILHRGVKKAQWAVFGAEEVAKFHVVIAAKIVSISLLLGIFNSDALARVECQNHETRKILLEKLDENRDGLESRMSKLAIDHHDALSTTVFQAEMAIKEDVSNLASETRTRHETLIAKAEGQTDKLNGLSRQLDRIHKVTKSNISQIVGLCLGTKLNNERMFRIAQQRFDKTGSQLRSLSLQQEQTRSQLSTGFRSVLSEIQILRTVGATLLSNLVPFSGRVLAYLRKNMKANMEIYTLLLKIQTSIAQGMFASQQDSIHFEDVLGRKKYLPYDCFRHLDVFESMLRCEFKGLPGESKVLAGDYIIMNSIIQGGRIEKNAWSQSVFPGIKLKMSVIIQALLTEVGYCPRPLCTGKVDLSVQRSVAHCPQCELAFVPERREVPPAPQRYRKDQSPKTSHMVNTTDALSSTAAGPAGGTQGSNRALVLSLADALKRLEQEVQDIMIYRMIHVFYVDGNGVIINLQALV